MKNLKKIFALVLAVMMIAAMSVSAWATEPTTFSITASAADSTKNEASHTYEIYQIFTGKVSDGKLIDLAWGQNAKDSNANIDDVAKALETATGTDANKLSVITSYVNLNDGAFKTVESGNSVNGVPTGYYLIKDQNNSLADKQGAYTLYIVKVINEDIKIQPKNEIPSVDKEVKDNDDGATTGDNNGWGETADHKINESFQFRLTATIPADVNLPAYTTYKAIFNDTMSDGVTFESIDSVKVGSKTLAASDYTSTATADQKGGSWSITIDNIKTHLTENEQKAAVTIEVIYNAHLNENAVLHNANATNDAANNNKVNLQYSNNPNADASGETGKTPDDTVFVFTYKIDNKKVIDQANGDALPNAGFTIKDASNNTVGLFYDSTKKAYRPAANGETAVTEIFSQSDGTFNIIGLDAGTYTFEETTVPEGYNKADNLTVTLEATHTENTSTTGADLTFTKVKNVNNTVIDKSGATLPSTGGIGTTIFYVLGSVLVLGAGIVLVTRKRMGEN